MSLHELTVVEHLYGEMEVEADNKKEAIEIGQEMVKEGNVRWRNTYEKVYFSEDQKPEFSPEYVWGMAREHTYFRKAIIDLKMFIEQFTATNPNVLAKSNNEHAEYEALKWLMINSTKIVTRGIKTDYEPRYDQIAEACNLLRTLANFNMDEREHYDLSDELAQKNHIYTFVARAIEFCNKLDNDSGEFILMETAGGVNLVQIIKDHTGKSRCFTSRKEAVEHGKQLKAPKVIRIR